MSQPPAIHYDAAGHVISDTLGDGEVESFAYNNRGWQQASLDQYQNNEWYGFNVSSFAPDGDILAASDTFNGNWTYTYDEFNRLVGSSQNNGAAVYSYAYDRFGNRWQQNGPQTMSLSFSGNNNRMDGYTYDTAGNLLNDGSHSYMYDAENRLIQVDGGSTATYIYDANGRRIENTGDYNYTPTGVVDYVYNLQGRLFFHPWENQGPSMDCCFYDFYLGDRHVYYSDQKFSHTDWLGTERFRGSTTKPSDYCASLPFGDALSCSNSGDEGDESSLHFTGQFHDWESGLDNFGARYNSSQLGRFMSPDPLGGSLIDPQTLNRYSYVRNNPINLTDPTGMYECSDDQNKCQTKQDLAFEAARQNDLKSKDADVVRAASAYGDPTKDNGVNVSFADLSKQNEGGNTTSTLGADANGNLQANSNVVINSSTVNAGGSALDAVVGHEGSHVADAQDLVNSITITDLAKGTFTVGQDITQYASEQRAYHVTDSILRSDNTSQTFQCGVATCQLGNSVLRGQVTNIVDQILRANYRSAINNQPLTEKNPGASVVPH